MNFIDIVDARLTEDTDMNTLTNVVMMGRKTIESLPKSLDRRIVLKVSNQEYAYSSLRVSLSDAEEYSDLLNTDKIFVAGGAKLYESTFDITDELLITEVANGVDNCDTWYKIPKDDFTMFEHTNWMEHTNPLGETLIYRFTKWIRKQAIPF